MELLADAGLGPEQPGERTLAFACRNAPVEVLLVRAADIPEYVQDGVVDCGITGADLVLSGAPGSASCCGSASAPARSRRRCSWSREAEAVEDLAGGRVATAYPVLARTLLAERGIEAELVEVTGSVEIAPRLGLADAIVDLVSSGNTLRTNGLRSVGALFRSEAVLIAGAEPDTAARELAPVLRSVVDARAMRYLMLNAPESAVPAICEIVPGSRAPTVLPLAEPGMVAVHALVPSAEVWHVLPRLERKARRRSCWCRSSGCSA